MIPALRKRPDIWFAAIAAALAVLCLDQLTKSAALSRLDEGPIELFWTLRLRLTFNSGVAFGLGEGWGGALLVAGLVLAGWIFVKLVDDWLGAIAAGAVVGGALGNGADRVLRDRGGVVDFIDFQWWPVFNLADVAIVTGVAVLVFSTRARTQ